MDIKLYHGGVAEHSRGFIFATPVRRIAEGYAILGYYFHREMGEETQPVVETGTGLIGWPDDAHALSYLMAEWNVLATDKVKVPRVPSAQDIYITSFCDDTKCQRCGTARHVRERAVDVFTKLAFIYCLCGRAESPRLDKEYASTD